MPASELSISQLLSAGFEAFKKNLSTTVLVFVGLEAAVFLVTYLLTAPVLNVLMLPVVILMQIALVKSYKNSQSKFDINEILGLNDSDLKDKAWRLFVTYIIYIVLIILLFLLLIIPGIIFMVFWYFFAYIVIDQKLTGMAALKKSREMIRGHWWKTFAIFVIAALLSGIVSSIVTNIVGQDKLIGGLLMSIISGIISIYFGYVGVAYYFNLKK